MSKSTSGLSLAENRRESVTPEEPTDPQQEAVSLNFPLLCVLLRRLQTLVCNVCVLCREVYVVVNRHQKLVFVVMK